MSKVNVCGRYSETFLAEIEQLRGWQEPGILIGDFMVDWASELLGPGEEADAARNGLLKVNKTLVTRINMLGEVMCAIRHSNAGGQGRGGGGGHPGHTLIIRSRVIEQAERLVEKHQGLVRVTLLRKAKVGLGTAGNGDPGDHDPGRRYPCGKAFPGQDPGKDQARNGYLVIDTAGRDPQYRNILYVAHHFPNCSYGKGAA